MAEVFGSLLPGDASLALVVSGLPFGAFGYLLSAGSTGFQPSLGGGSGTSCLSGPLGRINGPGQVILADAAGRAEVPLDSAAIQTASGTVPAMAGQTWHLQLWYRDDPAQGSFKCSNGIAIAL